MLEEPAWLQDHRHSESIKGEFLVVTILHLGLMGQSNVDIYVRQGNYPLFRYYSSREKSKKGRGGTLCYRLVFLAGRTQCWRCIVACCTITPPPRPHLPRILYFCCKSAWSHPKPEIFSLWHPVRDKKLRGRSPVPRLLLIIPFAGKSTQVEPWLQRERKRTVSVALVLCLHVGVDPPDLVKPNPAAKLECWLDPSAVNQQRAVEMIGLLFIQYEIFDIFWFLSS